MIQRLKNLWAWSAWHPVSNPPKELGFSWTGQMRAATQSPAVKMHTPFVDAKVIPYKKRDPIKEIIDSQ